MAELILTSLLTKMTLSLQTEMAGQTVQTMIRLLQQSTHGLHCLLFYLHPFETLLHGRTLSLGFTEFTAKFNILCLNSTCILLYA